jgi:hypothetical protein
LHFGKTEIFLFWGRATQGKSGIPPARAGGFDHRNRAPLIDHHQCSWESNCERYSLEIDADRAVVTIRVSFQLMNATFPKPKHKSHLMLKTGDSRSDTADRRGNTFDQAMCEIERGIETGSCVFPSSDAYLSLLTSKRVGDFGNMKRNGVEDCLLQRRENFHRV